MGSLAVYLLRREQPSPFLIVIHSALLLWQVQHLILNLSNLLSLDSRTNTSTEPVAFRVC